MFMPEKTEPGMLIEEETYFDMIESGEKLNKIYPDEVQLLSSAKQLAQ
jgi:hypothetical protein